MKTIYNLYLVQTYCHIDSRYETIYKLCLVRPKTGNVGGERADFLGNFKNSEIMGDCESFSF